MLHLGTSEAGETNFDASLSLQRKAVTPASLRWFLLRYPLMTLKVCAAIYWQALQLWRKGLPVYTHPKTQTVSPNNE